MRAYLCHRTYTRSTGVEAHWPLHCLRGSLDGGLVRLRGRFVEVQGKCGCERTFGYGLVCVMCVCVVYVRVRVAH